MSINHFLQIFWARRVFIALCTAAALIGAIVVCLSFPAVWQAHGKVLLNFGKADPVTGEVAATRESGNFLTTQISLITERSVMNKAIDTLGWTSDPTLISSFQSRSHSDKRDFRSFLADSLARNVQVKPVKDSTILDITYNGATPEGSRAVVQAILDAYATASSDLRNEEANKTAQFYEQELAKLKEKLDQSVTAETTYERQNGIVMANEKMDVESARLAALAGSGNPVMLPPAMADSTKQSQMELAGIDAQMAAASKIYGPNNPEMLALEKKHSDTVKLVAKDEAAVHAAMSASASGAGQVARELAQQKTKVVADSEKIGKLQTLQQDVDLRRADYMQAAAKYAVYKTQADQTNANFITVLGVETPQSPIFPNWTLVIPAAILLGLAVGLGMTLLLELLNPRVRGAEDIVNRTDTPVLAVVGSPPAPRRHIGARGARSGRTKAGQRGIARA
ncbi:MAG TPA: hypothetical protein VG248_05405 [Caulobacteraceae bacterium]|jgi:uncharacterized protein involved in exopolysaccharide biosynthesis|nr:hypothetical protein [Caulobacteraceae bacterium]